MRLIVKISQNKNIVTLQVIDQNEKSISRSNDTLKPPFLSKNGIGVVSAVLPFLDYQTVYLRGILRTKDVEVSHPLLFADENSAKEWIEKKAVPALKDWAENYLPFKGMLKLQYNKENDIYYFI